MDFELSGGNNDDRGWRVDVHHALADPVRLDVVDALRLTDRSPSELGELLGLPSNLLAHHLDVLEAAGVVRRRVSQGDRRRRYVTLVVEDPLAGPALPVPPARVLFVCSRNAARSQLAGALWTEATGRPAASAGATPADRVDPGAVAVATRHGLVLDGARPRGFDEVEGPVDLVVSVCDRAREQGIPIDAPALHWSVTDPAGGGPEDYQAAFDHLRSRIQRLVAAA